MLMEESARGSRVPCLVCNRQIDVDSSASGEKKARAGTASSERQGNPKGPLPARREKIVKCPECEAPLRVPPAHAGKPLKCPRCKKVFKP